VWAWCPATGPRKGMFANPPAAALPQGTRRWPPLRPPKLFLSHRCGALALGTWAHTEPSNHALSQNFPKCHQQARAPAVPSFSLSPEYARMCHNGQTGVGQTCHQRAKRFCFPAAAGNVAHGLQDGIHKRPLPSAVRKSASRTDICTRKHSLAMASSRGPSNSLETHPASIVKS
jgi:hypothetical protein